MFRNNLNPPPKKKSLTNVQTKCNNDFHDATMNTIMQLES